MREARVEQYLVSQVKKAGGMCIKLTGTNHIPDRLVILKNRMFFVELKRPGEDLRPGQREMQKRLTKLGAIAVMVNSIQDIDTLLCNFMNTKSE